MEIQLSFFWKWAWIDSVPKASQFRAFFVLPILLLCGRWTLNSLYDSAPRIKVSLLVEMDRGSEFSSNDEVWINMRRRPFLTTMSVMWIEKYRPKTLSDLISHTEIIATLEKLISTNQLPHLLFTGPPGTGKTSTILACARKMYGESYKSMVLELNASDDRGIDVVRDKIKGFVSTKQMFGKDSGGGGNIKLVVLDEADAMSSSAQMALRRVLEKYVSNARFCIICNYVNKIIPALQSRCTKFRFGPLPAESVTARLHEIAKQERIKVQPEGMKALLHLSKGDMRRSIHLMQSALISIMPFSEVLTADDFYFVTGALDPEEIGGFWQVLVKGDFNAAMKDMDDLGSGGVAINDLVADLLPLIASSKFHGANAKTYLYGQLADIEHRLCVGGSEMMNKAALVGAFTLAKSMKGNPESYRY